VVVFVSEAYRTSVTEVPELYAVVRYVSVITEGPREYFFEQTTEAGAEGENPNPMPDEVIRISRRSIPNEDMIELRGVVQVDDDNEPVPENVPDRNTTDSIMAAEFGHSGVCPRRMMGAANNKAKIHFANNIHPTRLQLFELFFPMAYIREVLLVETNNVLNGKELEYGEFLQWGRSGIGGWAQHQQRISFKYPELVYNHFQYRDAVDSHNARRMAPIALEETWQTKWWANRIFAYVIATTEVYCNFGESAFGETEGTRPQLEFRRLLANRSKYALPIVAWPR
jgi:hypothetical protein